MRQIWAIARLTLKSAVRSRFMAVFLILLVLGVSLLPALIRHNGTAAMFTQVMLTYTMVLLTTLLVGVTVWMACGAISTEVTGCQMQILTTKPVARWQIWVGKWFGLVLINGIFLITIGGLIYGLLLWGSRGLSADERDMLEKKLLVARGTIGEERVDRTEAIERIFQERMNSERADEVDPTVLREHIVEMVKTWDEVTPVNSRRRWDLDFGGNAEYLRDKALFIRVKMQAAQYDPNDQVYTVRWVAGDADSGEGYYSRDVEMIHNAYREIEIPGGAIDKDGKLRLEAWNYSRGTLRFPMTDPLEVLYPQGSFEANYVRGLMVILFWLATVAALGLAASAFLTLPVASFLTITVLVVFMSGGLLSTIVEQRTIGDIDDETGRRTTAAIDPYVMPFFKMLHKVVMLAQGASPIADLSVGRSVPWKTVAGSFFQQVFLLGGMMAVGGIILFNRREMAALQGGGGGS
jgi:ABC-type multidrug transport system fused ATPase/permease subunit